MTDINTEFRMNWLKENWMRSRYFIIGNWFRLSVLILLLFVVWYLATIDNELREIKYEIEEEADGIQVEIVDAVDGLNILLPKLPSIRI